MVSKRYMKLKDYLRENREELITQWYKEIIENSYSNKMCLVFEEPLLALNVFYSNEDVEGLLIIAKNRKKLLKIVRGAPLPTIRDAILTCLKI